MARGDGGRADSFSVPSALDRMSTKRTSRTNEHLARGMTAAPAGARATPAGQVRQK